MNERIGEINKNTFGTEMKIIAYRRSDDIDVQFLDKDEYIYEHQTYVNFKRGHIKNPYDRCIFDIGYLGEGNLLQRSQAGFCWRGMLERCYCDRLKKWHPAYYGISTVCDEWLNFQTFAKWYEENIYQVGNERMHLDKDILIKGNKLYSPDTCIIVPQKINVLFVNQPNKYGLPSGIKPTSSGRYEAHYAAKHLGTFNTLEEAVNRHDEEKRKALKNIAEEYKPVIPTKLYEALLSW